MSMNKQMNMSECEPSLCIPRVFANITEDRIRGVLDTLDLGDIRRIDIIERKNEKGEMFKRVFVHFNRWFRNDDAQTARNRLLEGKDIKIVYDNPWFWKVSALRKPIQKAVPKKTAQKPHIEFDDEAPRSVPKLKLQEPEAQTSMPKLKLPEPPKAFESSSPCSPPPAPRDYKEPCQEIIYGNVKMPKRRRPLVSKPNIVITKNPDEYEVNLDDTSDALYGDLH
jgi:hypothetical protein